MIRTHSTKNHDNKIISFFFLGTGAHRSSTKDVITAYYEAVNLQKKPHILAYLFDGVGSTPTNIAGDGKNHPTPGRYVYDAANNEKIMASDGILLGIKDLMQRLTGQLVGEGVDDLLIEALLYIKQLITKNNGILPTTLNLHGYSRGADTCMRLAHLLYSLYPEIKANLFLIDQVPGPGRWHDLQSYTVSANVSHFQAAIMLHEYRLGFSPQDRNSYVFASPTTTNVTINVYPGSHSRGMKLSDNENLNHVARLIHDDLYQFTTKTHSLAKDTPVPDYVRRHYLKQYKYSRENARVLRPRERFKQYNEMITYWNFYSKGTPVNKRNVLINHQLYSRNNRLFVNQEHGELLQELYPTVYDWFFNHTIKQSGHSKALLISHLDELRINNFDFYQNLCQQFNITNLNNLPDFSPGKPYFHQKLGQPIMDNNQLSYLQQSIIAIINYELHHKTDTIMVNGTYIKLLQDSLVHAAACTTDEDNIKLLKATIDLVCARLKKACQKNCFYRRLMMLKHTIEFIPTIEALLIAHLDDTNTLSSDMTDKLDAMRNKLAAIKDNYRLNYIEKINHAKKMVMSYQQLPTDFKNISGITFAMPSLATTINQRFESYLKHKFFWQKLVEILSVVISVDSLPSVLPGKLKLAQQLSTQLQALIRIGHANDIDKLTHILQTGQQELNTRYVLNRRFRRGELDAIMANSLEDLRITENGFLAIKTVDNNYSTDNISTTATVSVKVA